MKESTKQLLDKAARAIRAAQTLAKEDENDFAVGRVYYAMFYVAKALLGEKNLSFSKHGAVHAAFGQHFAKTGELDQKFHRWLLDSFDQRIQGDYGIDAIIQSETVTELIEQATEFLQAAKQYLKVDIHNQARQ